MLTVDEGISLCMHLLVQRISQESSTLNYSGHNEILPFVENYSWSFIISSEFLFQKEKS